MSDLFEELFQVLIDITTVADVIDVDPEFVHINLVNNPVSLRLYGSKTQEFTLEEVFLNLVTKEEAEEHGRD